jgi:hypothetical protein
MLEKLEDIEFEGTLENVFLRSSHQGAGYCDLVVAHHTYTGR